MVKMAEAAAFNQTQRSFHIYNKLRLEDLDALLLNIEQEFGTKRVCIAGGFLRDAAMVVTPTDIDVFIEYDFTNEAHKALAFAECEPMEYAFDEFVKSAHRSINFNGETWDLNLIFLGRAPSEDWTSHVLATFDLGLCQIGYTSRLGEQSSLAFSEDMRSKTLSVNPGANHYRLGDRLTKLLEKYPKHTVVLNGNEAYGFDLPDQTEAF